MVAANGLDADALMGQRLQPGDSILAEACAEGHAVAVDDRTSFERPGQLPPSHGGEGPTMVVPMRVRDQRLGLITITREKGSIEHR